MPVSVALVGCGNRGLQLANVIRRTGKLSIAAVCDVDETRLEAAKAALGVPGERDHQRLLQRSDVEAVVVATSARFHAPVTLDALAAKKHVYVEKPLADSPSVARKLAAAAESAGVVALVGYQRRFSPFSAALAAEVPGIEPIQCTLVGQRGPMNIQFFFPDHYGGIVDTATHTLDEALWTMGGKPEGVMGHVRRGTILGDRTIEFMELIIDFDGGTRSATVVSSMIGHGAANLHEYVGRLGNIWTTDGRTLHVSRHPAITEGGAKPPAGLERRDVAIGGGVDETGLALGNFADTITGTAEAGWPRGCSFAEGAYAIAASAAMVQSAEEGRRIRLDEVE